MYRRLEYWKNEGALTRKSDMLEIARIFPKDAVALMLPEWTYRARET